VRRLFGGKARRHQAPDARYHPPVSRNGRYVTITAVATAPNALQPDLRALGLQQGASAGRVVSGRLPISALGDATRLASLRGMVPAYAQTHVGRVGSEADTAHRAFEGRADLDVDGSRQKVCALSDSYNRSATAATSARDDIASGDLPGPGNPAGRTAPVDVLDDSEPGSDGQNAYGAEFRDSRKQGVISSGAVAHDFAPNPVTGAASVSVTVGDPQEVRMDVYNVLGQRVMRLHDGLLRANDPNTLTVGPRLQSGPYFLRVSGPSFTATRPFVRVR
jgi:hypothetical protein